MMIQFYKNRSQTFECSMKISGATSNNAKSRLILYPENDNKCVFFEGIVKNDTCLIELFPNININNKGKAVLEVIIDDSILFKPWETNYEIVFEEIKIEETTVKRSPVGASITVVNDGIKLNGNKISEVVKKQDINSNKHKEFSVKKETVNSETLIEAISEELQRMEIVEKEDKIKNKVLYEINNIYEKSPDGKKGYIEIYRKSMNKLSSQDITEVLKYIKEEYNPSTQSKKFITEIKGNPNNIYYKLLMYFNDLRINQGDKK